MEKYCWCSLWMPPAHSVYRRIYAGNLLSLSPSPLCTGPCSLLSPFNIQSTELDCTLIKCECTDAALLSLQWARELLHHSKVQEWRVASLVTHEHEFNNFNLKFSTRTTSSTGVNKTTRQLRFTAFSWTSTLYSTVRKRPISIQLRLQFKVTPRRLFNFSSISAFNLKF